VTLGGVRIPYSQGVKAHSDGDVLLHASATRCSARCASATSASTSRHRSALERRRQPHLLRHCARLLRENGYRLVNADLTVLAEAPRLGPHRAQIRANLASDLETTPDRINVKATTARDWERSAARGLACHAVVLLAHQVVRGSRELRRTGRRRPPAAEVAHTSIDPLSLPAAHGVCTGPRPVRVVPEDFRVEEVLGFEPDGDGAHVLLTVEKRGANTGWVVAQLARAAGVPPRDVGCSGHKDRNAVTRQACTLPWPAQAPLESCLSLAVRLARRGREPPRSQAAAGIAPRQSFRAAGA